MSIINTCCANQKYGQFDSVFIDNISQDNTETRLIVHDPVSKILEYRDVSSLPAVNPFDQSLNTTDSPSFLGLSVTNVSNDNSKDRMLAVDGTTGVINYVNKDTIANNVFNQSLNTFDNPSFLNVNLTNVGNDDTQSKILVLDSVSNNIEYRNVNSILPGNGSTVHARLGVNYQTSSTVINSAGVFERCNGITTITTDYPALFTQSANNEMTYVGTDNLMVKINAFFSVGSTNPPASFICINCRIVQNGTEIPLSTGETCLNSIQITQNVSTAAIVTLSQNDTISLEVANSSSTEDLTVVRFNFLVHAI